MEKKKAEMEAEAQTEAGRSAARLETKVDPTRFQLGTVLNKFMGNSYDKIFGMFFLGSLKVCIFVITRRKQEKNLVFCVCVHIF